MVEVFVGLALIVGYVLVCAAAGIGIDWVDDRLAGRFESYNYTNMGPWFYAWLFGAGVPCVVATAFGIGFMVLK